MSIEPDLEPTNIFATLGLALFYSTMDFEPGSVSYSFFSHFFAIPPRTSIQGYLFCDFIGSFYCCAYFPRPDPGQFPSMIADLPSSADVRNRPPPPLHYPMRIEHC